MNESKKIPLVSGLIGREARSVHGQLEVSLLDYDTINIALWRKPYSGRSDVVFSVSHTDFQELLDLLHEAKKKADTYWLARVAVEIQEKERKTSVLDADSAERAPDAAEESIMI